MRVDGPKITTAAGLNRIDRPKVNEARARAREAAEALSEDRLSLSSRALQVRDIEPVLSVMPSVRADLVNRLREQIQRGEYQVDPGRLADLLIRLRVVEP
ncbi:flagellar biosynthesis anti-sigma factor FlgM [Symbiobacterium terraclitae]|uniref:flagellar biosynthesis anti-sigma factor FlgM n=1 Tax=Symbiobacterium terraclitae TaxID=557451 RepID=UPI0035B551DB